MTSALRALCHHAVPTARAADQRHRRDHLDGPSGCWSGWRSTPPWRPSPRSAGKSKAAPTASPAISIPRATARTRCRLIGDALGKPLAAAGEAAPRHRRRRAQPRHDGQLAGVAAGAGRGRAADPLRRDAVAVPADPVLPSQVDRGHAGATPAGEQLLALRALANRPLAKLAAITPTRSAHGGARTPSRSTAWPPWSSGPPACGSASAAIDPQKRTRGGH